MQVNAQSYAANSTNVANYIPRSNTELDRALTAFFQERVSLSDAAIFRTLKFGAVFVGFSVALTICVDKFLDWQNRSVQTDLQTPENTVPQSSDALEEQVVELKDLNNPESQ
jgi:hypothetical protein